MIGVHLGDIWRRVLFGGLWRLALVIGAQMDYLEFLIEILFAIQVILVEYSGPAVWSTLDLQPCSRLFGK